MAGDLLWRVRVDSEMDGGSFAIVVCTVSRNMPEVRSGSVTSARGGSGVSGRRLSGPTVLPADRFAAAERDRL